MLQNSFGIFSVNNRIVINCISATFVIVILNLNIIFLNADVFLLIEIFGIDNKKITNQVFIYKIAKCDHKQSTVVPAVKDQVV